jgi:hypothetical protein
MRHSLKAAVIAVAAFCGGIAFVLSCGGGPSKGAAQLSCGSYDVRLLHVGDAPAIVSVPEGWTPIGNSGSYGNYVLLGRCAK